MLSFLGLNKYIIGGFGILIVLFGLYFAWSQWQLQEKAKDIASLKATVKQQELVIERFEDDIESIQEINKTLVTIERNANDRAAKLADTLTKLEKAATAKPGLVENLVNNATKERNRCLAIASGAEVTKEDKGNRVCPQLVE